jgi:hypothetical protein
MSGVAAHSEDQAMNRISPLHNFSAVRIAYVESLAQEMHVLVRGRSLTAAVSAASDTKATRHISRVCRKRYTGIREKPQDYVERSVCDMP